MKPIKVKKKPAAINGKRKRVRSEAKARMRSITAPEMFGATVYKLVFTVSYPSRATITGRKSWTDCRGTPRHISIPKLSDEILEQRKK